MMFGCSVAGRLQRQQMTASLSQLTRAERQERQQDYRPQVVKLQRDSNTFFLAPVDTLADGERVMALQIEQVTVVAKMRSIPERNGRVVLDFIVTLPKELLGKSRSVVITPILHKPDESVPLEDLVIRGGRFSLLQERDYWQYETYVERFRPDTVGREAAFNRFVKFPYPEDVRLDSLVDQGQIQRLGGASLDFLVVAAVASIRLDFVLNYWMPLLLLVLGGTAWSVFMVLYAAPRLFEDAWFERAIAEFGQSLGVTATGLLLLRTVDPENRTPAAASFGYKQLLHEPIMGGGIWTSLALVLVFTRGIGEVWLISAGMLVLWLLFWRFALKREPGARMKNS